ncbi:MAG: hypothetical protein HQL46_11900 [Gammaproteobacteria bacterium]|nr:hypothetical protein [Gammaproteobacteria bacterium]
MSRVNYRIVSLTLLLIIFSNYLQAEDLSINNNINSEIDSTEFNSQSQSSQKTHYGMGYEQRMSQSNNRARPKRMTTQRPNRPSRPQRPSRH